MIFVRFHFIFASRLHIALRHAIIFSCVLGYAVLHHLMVTGGIALHGIVG